MRKIFDDTHYAEIANEINETLKSMPKDKVCIDRGDAVHLPNEDLILGYITDKINNIKLGDV